MIPMTYTLVLSWLTDGRPDDMDDATSDRIAFAVAEAALDLDFVHPGRPLDREEMVELGESVGIDMGHDDHLSIAGLIMRAYDDPPEYDDS